MDEILKELSKITGRGYSPRSVFSDWLNLMLYSFMRNDEEYLKIVGRYRNDKEHGNREIDFFARALGLLMKCMAEHERDILGELYMSWEISNKYTGQFFTPWHIARMLADITKPEGGTISDPTCGSGIMLIASALSLDKETRFKTFFVGQDLDHDCVVMCVLNLLFFNLNGYVIQGNTLAMEYDRVYRTFHTSIGGEVCELDKSQFPTVEEVGQLSLLAA